MVRRNNSRQVLMSPAVVDVTAKRVVEARRSSTMLREMAYDGSLEWVDNLIRQHESGIRELQKRREQLLGLRNNTEPQGCAYSAVSVMGWVVNDLQNIQRNLRLDLVANNVSALVLSDPQLVEDHR